MINCGVFNKFDREISLKPQFEIFKRSSFSDLIEINHGDENIVLTSKEEKKFSFVVPKNNTPQAYDIKLSFLDNDEIVSNFVLFHYVLSGSSGTIQSIQMDKEDYLKDDIARIKLFWSGSADIFTDSRSGKSPADEMVSFSLNIKNDDGKLCIEPIDKNLEIEESLITIEALIINECKSLNVEGILKDSTGKILDRKVFSLVNNSNSEEEPETTDYSVLMLICAIVAIIILIFNLIKIRKKKYNEIETKNDDSDSNIDRLVLSITLSFLIVSTFFLISGLKTCSAEQVQAYIEWHFDTEADAIAQGRGDEWAGGIWDDSLFTVGLGKDTYGYNEPLDGLATNVTNIRCGNNSSAAVYVDKFDFEPVSPKIYLINENQLTAGNYSFYGIKSIPQNLSPGEHTVYLKVVYHHAAYNFTETIPVEFTVLGKAVSGKVTNDKGNPISGVDIDLCGTESVTDAYGNYSTAVHNAASYCSRIDSGLPSGYTSIVAKNNNSCFGTSQSTYESQLSGKSVFVSCSSTGSGLWDRNSDSDLDFVVNYPESAYSCIEPIPNSTLCLNDDVGLTNTDVVITLKYFCSSPAGSNPKCEVTCDTGYHKLGKTCVPNIYHCTGGVSHSTSCSNDGINLTVNTDRTLVTDCSSPEGSDPKCEVVCDIGYVKNGNTCVTLAPIILNGVLNVSNVVTGTQPTASWRTFNSVKCNLVSNTGYNNLNVCNSLTSCASVSLPVDEVMTETTYTLTCFNELGTSVTAQTTPADYMVLSANPNDVGINFDLATGTTEPEVELNLISWNGFKDPITITSDILTALPESPGDETTNHLIITPDRVYSFTDYYTNNLKPLLEIFASYRFVGSKTVQVSATDSNSVNINILGESTVPIYEPF